MANVPTSTGRHPSNWALIELAAFEEFPEIQAAIDVDIKTGLAVLAERISVLFDKWWFALHRIMANGPFGPYGKQLGWLVWEIGRPNPFASK